MGSLFVLAPLLGAILIGAISPGPSFVLVARTAIAVSRLDGVGAALGMGLGASIFAAGALLGLQAVLTSVPSVYIGIKIIGGLYLLYLAVRLWRSASETITIADAPHDTQSTVLRSFFLGLATQLSNPKTAVVYASIFAAMLPSDQTWSSTFAIVPLIFAIETEVSRPARLHQWPYANYGAVALTRGPKTSCSVRGLHGCALQHAPMLGDLPVP